MPNWSFNYLQVIGDKKEVAKFKEEIKGKDTALDFEKSVPMPENIYRGDLGTEEEEKYGKENCWYEWSIKNWGTKWNASEAEIIETEGEELIYKFETAWSPPVQWLISTSKKYPKLRFAMNYDEESEAFNGKIFVENGEYHDTYFSPRFEFSEGWDNGERDWIWGIEF